MRITGVTHPLGTPVVSFTVAHGAHPRTTLFDHGYVPERSLAATLVDDDIIFTWLVRKATDTDQPPNEDDATHLTSFPEQQHRHQRVGAYAIVLSDRGILGTVNSASTPSPGTWALPGGGVDPGESPAEAVLREIFEETGQHSVIDQILGLDSEHWVRHSDGGIPEDFHALRVIYSATCETPSDPVVHDVGGSTLRASWVPLSAWRSLRWTNSSRATLMRYVQQLSQTGQSLK